MAVQRIVRFVDDVDGGEAAETVHFGLDGIGYEVDLSAANAAELRAMLSPYVAAARPVGRIAAGSAGRVRQAMSRANSRAAAANSGGAPAGRPTTAPADPDTDTDTETGTDTEVGIEPGIETGTAEPVEEQRSGTGRGGEVIGIQFSDRPPPGVPSR